MFTAVARTDGGLRWTAVTIDSGDVAKAALDRITLPQDVLDRIAPTALPRSSLIISDEPLHRETNYRTEFVIALNDQPQGGIITRPRSPDTRVGFGGWLGFQQYARARRPVLRSAAEQPELLSAATALVVKTRRVASRPHGTQGMRNGGQIVANSSWAWARVGAKRGSEKRTTAEKREYIRHCRPRGVSIAEGCRLMGIGRSAFYDTPEARCAANSLRKAAAHHETS